QQMAAGALDAARRIARGLSPTVLTDLGLAPALRRVCEDVARASGIEIACDLQPASERPDPPVEIAIYRVAQEALTNAARHSGATYIRLALRFTDTRVRLTVTDNGRGFSANRDAAGSGVGLASMRERVSLLGGVFEAASRAGVTTIRADLPRRPVPS
ncbi:MAG: histidine kinase, partial [Phycisphaerae bacterium]|nr:histidine kinase [Phycisphaerae bacterium]